MSITPIRLTDLTEIFPSTKTKTINKLITENSLTRLLNRLVDVDSYIISSEFTTDINNNYDYVIVDNDILGSDLEICIRGYYFNLGSYSYILSKIVAAYPDLNTDDIIKAIIYVDTTSNPEYPELYGQDGYEQFNLNSPFQFPEGCNNNNVTGIKFYDSLNNQLAVSYSGIGGVGTAHERYLIDSNGNEVDLDAAGVTTITYYMRTVIECVTLYRPEEGEQLEPPNTGLTPYELTLFKLKDTSTFMIPVSSFHKFSSISVSNIDGGLITSAS